MPDISVLNLAAVDLNLLCAFETLMAERNVTRAGEQMGLTQSAMSNTLARLRTLLGDPVLVRRAGGMKPTDRALELVEPIADALRTIRGALAPRERFAAARSHHRFRIVNADLSELVLVPPLLRRLRREAPGVDLELTRVEAAFPAETLRSGEVDFAIVGNVTVPDGFAVEKLLEEEFVCIVRRNHPVVRSRLTLKRYVELGHVLVSPFGGRGGNVDQVLGALGHGRRVALQTRHFLVSPLLVAQSDLVATVPRRLAEMAARLLPLRIFPPPIRLASFPMRLVWHGRNTEDPAHRWFRELLVDVAAKISRKSSKK